MIITIMGTPGSGKTTVAKLLARKLGYESISIGEIWRGIAEACGLTMEDFLLKVEKTEFYDKLIDEFQEKLAVTKDNIVVDSRLAWHFIPKSFKLFLSCSEEEQARRLFKRQDGKSFEDALSMANKRTQADITRYQKLYGLNPYNTKNFDMVINTNDKLPEEIVDEVIEELKKKRFL